MVLIVKNRTSVKLFTFPSFPREYFYYLGSHYVSSNNGYFRSYSLNEYGMISFDKTKCYYEQISKKEFVKFKDDFDSYSLFYSVPIKKIQLSFSF